MRTILVLAALAVAPLALAEGDAPGAEPEPEEWDEDGVTVKATTVQPYCITRGKTKNICGRDRGECTKLGGKAGRCRSAKAISCFDATARTTAETRTLCFTSYGLCDGVSHDVNASDEFTVTECWIVRHRPPAKKKK